MPQRTIDVDGRRWAVVSSGRRTQYTRDEFGLVFTALDGSGEHRVARYSPLGAKRREASLARLSDPELIRLLRHSQPGWTSPDLGYRR